MKSLVLLSGGMDSSVALAWALKAGYAEAVSFNYGQRHNIELESAQNIAEFFLVNHTILDLRGASAAFQGSALTGGGDVPEGHYADESMRKTVVPNRNGIMLSLAAGLAVSRGLDTLLYAAHAGDHDVYPDCRKEFVDALGMAIKEGNYNGPVLVAPFLEMSKAEIAEMGSELRVPFELTHSCYNGVRPQCGKCSTCVERREAFHIAGVNDPTEYEDKTDFWKMVCNIATT